MKICLKIIKIYLYMYLPIFGLLKGPAPLFEKIWIPISQACFLLSLVEIGLVVLEKIFKQFPIYYYVKV